MSVQEIFEEHPWWQAVKSVIAQLEAAGHQALIAGGSVRDALMGVRPGDFDVATSATPDQVAKVFPRALDIGKAFGVMIIPQTGFKVEVATFRVDGPYLDGRRPNSVTFSDAKNDALRRDFTVNGLFYDLTRDAVLDFVDGKKDIEGRVLRAVGDPEKRFSEDKLRMLRAVRFVSQLGFHIEEKTRSAILKQAPEVMSVSKERITDEFKKLVQGRNLVHATKELRDLGLLKILFPQLTFVGDDFAFERFLNGTYRLCGLGRLSIFLVWIGLQELFYRKASSEESFSVYDYWTDEKRPLLLSRELKREIQFLAEGFDDLLQNKPRTYLRLADPLGPLLTEMSFMAAHAGFCGHEMVRQIIDLYLSRVDAEGHLPAPWISGEDLVFMGLPASPQMRIILEDAYEIQLSGQKKSPEELKRFLREKYKI